MHSIPDRIARELNVRLPQVQAAIALLDEKATVPFIARYRKEATGGLDDTALRTLEERLAYLRELEARRIVILETIEEQGHLTAELAASIRVADTKARLEVFTSPARKRSSANTAWWNGIVVFTPLPSTWNSESARRIRSIALGRSGAHTISFAIRES